MSLAVYNPIQLQACIKTELRKELSKINDNIGFMDKQEFEAAIKKAGPKELSEVLTLLVSWNAAKEYNEDLRKSEISEIRDKVKKGVN
jgi:hypothetical protein